MGEKKLHLSREEREFLRHRREILDTALDLFSEKGLHNVAMHVFLNVSLACDYRIVAENTVFQNPCLERAVKTMAVLEYSSIGTGFSRTESIEERMEIIEKAIKEEPHF